ncbi:hypothetical protein G3M48_006935 [Beauveria asiatica]|uniref:Uncharacterized protein n=1 Tax=Beauveria asiatica TaxID=1069075 RepID=A0AAW0RN53_9HYPO
MAISTHAEVEEKRRSHPCKKQMSQIFAIRAVTSVATDLTRDTKMVAQQLGGRVAEKCPVFSPLYTPNSKGNSKTPAKRECSRRSA